MTKREREGGREGERERERKREEVEEERGKKFNKMLFYIYMVSILNFCRTERSEAEKFTKGSMQSGIFVLQV